MNHFDLSLFYLTEVKDVYAVTVSLNELLKPLNMCLDEKEVHDMVMFRERCLKEVKLFDFSYSNLVRSFEIAIMFENRNKQRVTQLCYDIMEIFYYVKSTYSDSRKDNEWWEQIADLLSQNEGDIESVRGFYESYSEVREDDDVWR